MRPTTYARRWLPRLGEGPARRASSSAIMAPPPGPGEVRRTALPDTFDGIRFEIGRMIKYVQAAQEDPIVVANTQAVCSEHIRGLAHSARMNGRTLDGLDPRTVCVEAIDRWCREHFVYVNDPPNIEVIQTPRRMIQIMRVPPEVLRHVISPFFDAMKGVAEPSAVEAYLPPRVCSGDCDEGGMLFNAHCAGCRMARIRPVLFHFGGHDGTIHHVWSRVGVDGRYLDSDLTEPDYELGDFSKFPHYETVEVPLDGSDDEPSGLMGIHLGLKELGEEEETSEVPEGFRHLAERVAAGRKDAVLVDCARLLGVHYGKMVEHFSAVEGRPVSAHNNKTLFLEGIDLWSRTWLSAAPRPASGETEDPREVVTHLMRPWYEALELDDPSQYRMRPQAPPPAYVGSPEDATCTALALSACLDITPISFAVGLRDGQPERVWGRVHADGKVYDSDVNEPFFILGDRPEYAEIKEIEVPL